MEERNHIDHYANALYSIWLELEKSDKKIFTSSAKDIYFSLKNNYEIVKIISSSNIERREKAIITKKIFSQLSIEILPNQYIYNFLFVLIDNNFFGKILEIFISFFEKLDNHQNFIFLRIYSPFVLNKDILEKIELLFSKKTGKKVRYENIIDNHLIGGMKIMFGNEVYDYSIKGRIEKIKWNLQNDKEV